MLFTYGECVQKYGNDYQLQSAVSDGKLYKIEPGVYSDKRAVSEIAILQFKYPETVFTMASAFFFYSFTDVIPEKQHLATHRDAAKIKDSRVKQYFYNKDAFETGITKMNYQDTVIRIYSKERMLIELIRSRNKLSFDYYKEIIAHFRNNIAQMDIQKVQEYLAMFSKPEAIMNAIQLEVL